MTEKTYDSEIADEMPGMMVRNAGKLDAREAVESLYERHLEEVHRYLLRTGVNPSQAEDICQEAFVRLFLALRQGQRIGNPRAWLFAVAHNTGVNAMKASLRSGSFDPEMESALAGREPDPEQAVLEREKFQRIRRALAELTAHQRHCLHLRAEGLRYREIAEIVGIGITAIAESVDRAVKRIREALND